jgi:hypothetical protein
LQPWLEETNQKRRISKPYNLDNVVEDFSEIISISISTSVIPSYGLLIGVPFSRYWKYCS